MVPTVPILLFPSEFVVATAVFSVMPYPSKTLISNDLKNVNISGFIGAAPVPA